MSNTDAAWLAGIMDGEGTFQIAILKRSGHLTFYAEASVVNTNPKIVDRCREITGGHIVNCFNKKHGKFDPSRHKKSQRWAIKFRKAEEVARVTIPYLVAKREQAEILQLMRLYVRTGARPGQRGRSSVTPEEWAGRWDLKRAVMALNKRGSGSPDPEQLAALERVRHILNSYRSDL